MSFGGTHANTWRKNTRKSTAPTDVLLCCIGSQIHKHKARSPRCHDAPAIALFSGSPRDMHERHRNGSDSERGLGVGTRTSPAHPRFYATKQQLRHDYMTRLQQDYTCEFILELTFHPLNPVVLEQRRASV